MKSRLILPISAVIALIGVLMIAPGVASAKSTVTTGSATAWVHSAELNGSFSSDAAGGFYGFEYGKTTAYGSEVTAGSTQVSESKSFSATVKGLEPETTYHYRAALMNGLETVYGEDKTFTTGSVAKFAAAEYPAVVSGEQDAGDPLVLGVEGGSMTCEQVTMSGGALAAASSLLSFTPSLSGCEVLGVEVFSVKTNGCVYGFWAGDPGEPEAALAISCPPEKAIEFRAGTCEFSIPAQQLTAVTANQQGVPSQIGLDLDIPSLDYTVSRDGYFCPFKGAGAKEGSYSGTLDLNATNGSGTPIALTIGV